jgi:hypothetical protein
VPITSVADLGILEQARSMAKIQEHSMSVSPSTTRLPVHRRDFFGDFGDQSENQRGVNHYMKEFPANLLMALAWFFRSFERSRSEAGKYAGIDGSLCSRLLNLDVIQIEAMIA